MNIHIYETFLQNADTKFQSYFKSIKRLLLASRTATYRPRKLGWLGGFWIRSRFLSTTFCFLFMMEKLVGVFENFYRFWFLRNSFRWLARFRRFTPFLQSWSVQTFSETSMHIRCKCPISIRPSPCRCSRAPSEKIAPFVL